MPQPSAPQSGRVYLVGAGPGDPGLIALRGVECLRRADLVLYDYLVNPRILAHAPARAETVCLGRHGQDRLLPQAEVNARLVAAARAGKTVVRLKGGDPLVFARAADELAALIAAGVPFEIVPGITAALAAGSCAGIPLTDRELSSAVALVTGQENEEKESPPLDYDGLAAFPGTLVFYMGVTTAPRWTAALMAAGKPPATPAAIVRRCSWPDQVTVACTLGSVADELARRRMRPPVIVIVGDVAAQRAAANWFTSRPLFGRTVLVTRPADQALALVSPLEELGANVLLQPAIEIADPDERGPVDAAIERLHEYDWLVFSSANGVRQFLNRLCRGGRDLRRLGTIRLAAIGPGTADELACWNLTADLVPDEYRAEALAASLAAAAAGRKFLLARASRGREVLAEQLREAGASVDQVVVYRSSDVAAPQPHIAEQLAAGKIDWVTVTSSAIARSLAAMFGDALKSVKLASISPVTSATLAELGLAPAAEAREYTMRGVVDAIVKLEQGD